MANRNRAGQGKAGRRGSTARAAARGMTRKHERSNDQISRDLVEGATTTTHDRSGGTAARQRGRRR